MRQDAVFSTKYLPILGYGLLYLAAAETSHLLAAHQGEATPIWFAAGVGMAAVLLHGYRGLAGVVIGQLIALLLHFQGWTLSAGELIGLILEMGIGYGLINRFSRRHQLLEKPLEFSRFLLICVAIAPVFSTLPGGLGLLSTQQTSGMDLVGQLTTWWAADALGILLLTPTILFLERYRGFRLGTGQGIELIVLFGATLLLCFALFSGYLPQSITQYPVTFLFAPLLVWCVFRFSLPVSGLQLLLVAISALVGTALGHGPFSAAAQPLTMPILQLYIGTICATALMGRVVLDEREQTRHQLQLASKVMQNTPDAIIVTDKDTRILSANPAFIRNTGFSAKRLLGSKITLLKSGYHDSQFYAQMWDQIKHTGAWEGEVWNRDRQGTIKPEWLNIIALHNRNREVTGYIGLYSDVAHRKEVMDRMRHLAYHDGLTDLPNRQLFSDRLAQALKYAERNKRQLALLFVDLDRFKTINDTLGHRVGDKVLEMAAERMRACVRDADTLARLGGDEFTVILQDIGTQLDAELVAEKILNQFKSPLRVRHHQLYITPSIGIAQFPDNGRHSDELIGAADTAMYRAKELGGNRYHQFNTGINEPFRRNLEVEGALRRAIAEQALQLYYQPQFDLHTGAVIGVEGLARWNDPQLGTVSPGTFIRIAEHSSVLHILGEQMLATAARQAVAWGRQGITGLRIAINISPYQLKQSDFPEQLRKYSRHCHGSGNRLAIEVTESGLMENTVFMEEMLQRLAGLDMEIAIDDFGTGQTSLSYLRKLPIAQLKIDTSLIQGLPENGNNKAICRAIIAMSHSLKLRVLAEGVETEQQMRFLHKENCDEMQGFLYSKPVTAEEIGEMIRQGFWQLGDRTSPPPPERPVVAKKP